MRFEHVRVLVRGGGDLASGVVYRLTKAGFPVIITELAQPLTIRRTVAFGAAVYEGEIALDGVQACRADDAAHARAHLGDGIVPVLVDPEGVSLGEFAPLVVIDARLAKRNLGGRLGDARLVVALGPGFEAGCDCHAVIETNRGHDLGRVLWRGAAQANTGVPGAVGAYGAARVLRAPAAGRVAPHAAIGDALREGEIVAEVAGRQVRAPFAGMLRGLIHPSVEVREGMKIGDVDPRGVRAHCFTISDKALAIGGGAVEAVLSAPQLSGLL